MLSAVLDTAHPKKENIVNTSLFARRFARSCIASLALLAVLISTLFVSVVPARAADGVVSNCSDDAELSSLLVGGGTISFNCGTALIHLSNTILISANTTIDGGGLLTLSGDNERQFFVVDTGAMLTLRNIVLTNGFSPGDGGAINNRGTLALENSTIRNSQAQASGGAIVSYGPLYITNSVLEGNRAANGGALYPRWSNARTSIANSVLRNNRTTDTTNGAGGAILAWDGAPVYLEFSDIYSNTAALGGGIYNFAHSLLFLNSGTRLHDNAASHSGGGILNDEGATMTVINTTFSGNSASRGGGISNVEFGRMTLTNATLIYNSSGALDNEVGGLSEVTVKNTIVAHTFGGPNCSRDITNSGFNLSSDASCGFGSGRDSVMVLLGELADNGGPTQTHLPQAGSPAIDGGAGCPSEDQRGINRPQGAACDIGAVEVETQVQQ
jgi:hypothetical protein